MKTYIQLYEDIVAKVKVFYEHLKLHKLEKRTGRKLSVTAIESIALSLFKQSNHIATKKSIWKIFQPHCSYKTLSENMKKNALLAASFAPGNTDDRKMFEKMNKDLLGIFVADAGFIDQSLWYIANYIYSLLAYVLCAQQARWKLVENSHLCKTGQEVLGVWRAGRKGGWRGFVIQSE